MEENSRVYRELSESDWEKTPTRVKQLVEKMAQVIKELEKRLAEVEALQQELLEKTIAHRKIRHYRRQKMGWMWKRNQEKRVVEKREGDSQDIRPSVIHRDIKPSNILLGDRSGNSIGQVYLVDFGSVQTLAAKEKAPFNTVRLWQKKVK